MNLHAKVDNVGPVEITGTINPLSWNQTNELKIVVKNVDLTPTSPYVGRFAGYRLAQGKVEMTLAYHLYERKLKSANLIVLDRFTFGEKVNSPDATKLPVSLAIAILKDRDGKIKLDVPIEGSLDDPQFRLHKVIVSAIVNMLTKIATSPFSALGAVFGGRGEEIRYQDFAPGSAELQAASKRNSTHSSRASTNAPRSSSKSKAASSPTRTATACAIVSWSEASHAEMDVPAKWPSAQAWRPTRSYNWRRTATLVEKSLCRGAGER